MGGSWWTRLLPSRTGGPALGVVSAADLRAWMAAGDTLLVDVREAWEHERRSIPGAVSLPLSHCPFKVPAATGARRVVFHCQSGTRTRMAGPLLAASAALPAYALAGGMDVWGRG